MPDGSHRSGDDRDPAERVFVMFRGMLRGGLAFVLALALGVAAVPASALQTGSDGQDAAASVGSPHKAGGPEMNPDG
jgi:hypothetical protein